MTLYWYVYYTECALLAVMHQVQSSSLADFVKSSTLLEVTGAFKSSFAFER
ncbi:hypothetical protein [Paenibacillus xylanexedens]|uniref:hypothetical protein n=1 Tax=Paenibacillus xylanexedens TaxID=528191 RepID=UPI001C92BB60|nr:hypothetical protein [Paenibacillus xylanexedens]